MDNTTRRDGLDELLESLLKFNPETDEVEPTLFGLMALLSRLWFKG